MSMDDKEIVAIDHNEYECVIDFCFLERHEISHAMQTLRVQSMKRSDQSQVEK